MERNARRDQITALFRAAVDAADPYRAVSLHTGHIRSVFEEEGLRRLVVTGFGKAASPMMKAVMDDLGEKIETGIIITKYGHAGREADNRITVYEAGHPLPDENGVNATEKVIGLLGTADAATLMVCLISGGGSALLVSPFDGISLAEKQTATELLLNAGADIVELNTVRKHISAVKGGRLAEIAHPGRVISLVLSDVIGDRLDVIASGPTAPDSTTYRDALEVVERYGLARAMPQRVIETLSRGVRNLIPETPKESSPVFARVENIIVGSNRKAIDAARDLAAASGFETSMVSDAVRGEARVAGRWLAQKTLELKTAQTAHPRRCLISGGETTVTVKGKGKGGRNMELALAFALSIEGRSGITFLSAGTDGTDGPTDAAGAIVTGETVREARALGINPEEHLEGNDSYHFFLKTGSLLMTGPTRTNVMDIQIALLDG
jgi:hydroxypyruvate reductase/glycerate 2-kinase